MTRLARRNKSRAIKRRKRDAASEPIIQCWCGAAGTYSDLFDTSSLEDGCGGTRMLHCYCGGDQCVCHHHGETECCGCEDCEGDEGDDFDDGSFDYDDEIDPDLREVHGIFP